MELLMAFIAIFEGNGKFVLGLAIGSGIVWQFIASPLQKRADKSEKELKDYYISELEFYKKLKDANNV